MGGGREVLTCRMNVLFPPMLGPVTSVNQLLPLTSLQSLATNATPSCASTQGCRQPCSATSSFSSGRRMVGRT